MKKMIYWILLLSFLPVFAPVWAQDNPIPPKEENPPKDEDSRFKQLSDRVDLVEKNIKELMFITSPEIKKDLKKYIEETGALKEKLQAEVCRLERKDSQLQEDSKNAVAVAKQEVMKSLETLESALRNLVKAAKEALERKIEDEGKTLNEKDQELGKAIQNLQNILSGLSSAFDKLAERTKKSEDQITTMNTNIGTLQSENENRKNDIQAQKDAHQKLVERLDEETKQRIALEKIVFHQNEALSQVNLTLAEIQPKVEETARRLITVEREQRNLQEKQREMSQDLEGQKQTDEKFAQQLFDLAQLEVEKNHRAKYDSLVRMMKDGKLEEKINAIGKLAFLQEHGLLFEEYEAVADAEIKKTIAKSLVSLFRASIEDTKKLGLGQHIPIFIGYAGVLLENATDWKIEILDCLMQTKAQFDFTLTEHQKTLQSVVKNMNDAKTYLSAFELLNALDAQAVVSAVQVSWPSLTTEIARQKALELWKNAGLKSREKAIEIGKMLVRIYKENTNEKKETQYITSVRRQILQTIKDLKPQDIYLPGDLILAASMDNFPPIEREAVLQAIAAIPDSQIHLMRFSDTKIYAMTNETLHYQAELAVEALIRVKDFSEGRLALFTNEKEIRRILLKPENQKVLGKSSLQIYMKYYPQDLKDLTAKEDPELAAEKQQIQDRKDLLFALYSALTDAIREKRIIQTEGIEAILVKEEDFNSEVIREQRKAKGKDHNAILWLLVKDVRRKIAELHKQAVAAKEVENKAVTTTK